MASQIRHINDERWHTIEPVAERREVVTPFGRAIAEAGTFIATAADDPTYQVILSQDDLENVWTSAPVPPTPEPGPSVTAPAPEPPPAPVQGEDGTWYLQ